MFIIAVGVNHKRAPVGVREKLTFDNAELPLVFHELKATGNIAGCVILSTCNRTEIYAASRDIDAALSQIWKLLAVKSGIHVEELQDYLYNITCHQAIAHLFRVASGLDSMILGETEILGQVAKAYETACQNSATNSVLNVLFQKALKVGKQVRTRTHIGKGASSVGSVAVELARQASGDIKDCTVLLIGAGEMGMLVARNLASNGVSQVMVCNRSHDRARKLAAQFAGRAVPFEELYESMTLADLVVTCTAAPDYIITKEQLTSLMEARHGKPIFLVDLAVPRDIEPESAQLEHLHLYNIDDLQNIVDENLDERNIEAAKAEQIVGKAVDNFLRWINGRSAIPVIEALRQKGEDIKEVELEKAIRKLQPLSERQEKVLRSLVNSVANKLINTPIVQLREYAHTEQGHLYAQVLRNLFDLPVQIDSQPALTEVTQLKKSSGEL